MLAFTVVVSVCASLLSTGLRAWRWARRRHPRGSVHSRAGLLDARHEQIRYGSLITRNTNDIQQIQLFLQMALTMMVIAPIMCVGGIILAIHEGAQLSTLLLVAVPLMAIVIGTVMVKVIPQFSLHAGQDRTASTRCCASRSPACG